MPISITSASKAITFAQSDAGVVSIATQTDGLTAGLMAGLTGKLNGGATAAIGLANTIVEVGVFAAGVAVANKTEFTRNWPVIGQPR